MTTTTTMRPMLSLSVALFLLQTASAWQNIFSGIGSSSSVKQSSSNALSFRLTPAARKRRDTLEDELIQAIDSEQRLSSSEKIRECIDDLINSASELSIPSPAVAPEVYGRWRLLHTDNADTASPIQRKAVDASKFSIYQDIVVREPQKKLVVSQVVQFNNNFRLCVDAVASTPAYPLQELTERKGDGKILGLNLLGVSAVGEEAAAKDPNARIDFVFDEGNFELPNGSKIPYPVPFRLPVLRDTVKGWIDIVYLSERIRISQGNKGTTFVLLKEEE